MFVCIHTDGQSLLSSSIAVLGVTVLVARDYAHNQYIIAHPLVSENNPFLVLSY